MTENWHIILKKLVAAIAQSKYIDEENFLIERISFKDLYDSFLGGKTIKEIYVTKDNVFGGNYYFGRYIFALNRRFIYDPINKKTIKLFNINYIVDNPSDPRKTKIF